MAVSKLTDNELIALGDEISALTRAGAPLDRGLVALGRELPGRLKSATGDIGERLAAGERLGDILADSGGRYPSSYASIVEAGIRSGRLPAALQSVCTCLRRQRDMRKILSVSLLYPAAVLLVAIPAFWLVIGTMSIAVDVPGKLGDAQQHGIGPASQWVEQYSWLILLLPIVAVLVLFVGLWLRWRSERSGPGRVRSAGRMAVFAETLSLLVECKTPLPEGMTIAADASGNRKLQAQCAAYAQGLRDGVQGDLPAEIPPLMSWLLTTADSQPNLAQALRRTAESYHERSSQLADWYATFFPIWFTLLAGGGATLMLGLCLISGYSYVLYSLSG